MTGGSAMRPHASTSEGQGGSSLTCILLLLPEVLPLMDRLGRGDSNGGVASRNQLRQKKLPENFPAVEVI